MQPVRRAEGSRQPPDALSKAYGTLAALAIRFAVDENNEAAPRAGTCSSQSHITAFAVAHAHTRTEAASGAGGPITVQLPKVLGLSAGELG